MRLSSGSVQLGDSQSGRSEKPRVGRAGDGGVIGVAGDVAAAGASVTRALSGSTSDPPRPRKAQPQVAGRIGAVARRPQLQPQPPHRRERPLGAVETVTLAPLDGLEDDRTHIGEWAHAAGAGLGHQQQAIGGDEVDPTARPLPAEVLRAEIAPQVVIAQATRTEEKAGRRRAGAAAVMPGASELPIIRLAGDGMHSGLGLARPEVEGPRLGVQGIADNQRADVVADGL